MLKRILKTLKLYPRYLILLLGIIIAALTFYPSTTEETVIEKQVKEVEIFEFNDAYIETIAKTYTTETVDIFAQVAGVVTSVYVPVGQNVATGEPIVGLAQNYSGTAARVQAQIAQKQYENARDTLPEQISQLELQEKVATLSFDNATELRQIAEASLNDTNALVDTAEDQLDSLEAMLNSAQQVNDTEAIKSISQSISSLQAQLAQLKASQRTLSYQASDVNAARELLSTTRQNTLQGLELQKKATQLSVEIARLNSLAAQIQAANYAPVSPVYGRVESVYVALYQQVNPGQKIATIRTNTSGSTLTTYISSSMYPYIETVGAKIITEQGDIPVDIEYISAVPTDGILHQITLRAPHPSIFNEFVRVKLPLVTTQSKLIPLSALYQSRSSSHIYLALNNQAYETEVKTGRIVGNFVELLSPLPNNPRIIVSRNVIDADSIHIK